LRLTVKKYEFGWHYALLTVWKRIEKLLMLSTVMRTVNELMETVTANVTIWTMFFRRTNVLFFGIFCAFCKRFLHML